MDLLPRFLVWVRIGVSLREKATPWVALSVDSVSCICQTDLRIILGSAERWGTDFDCTPSEVVATIYSLVVECPLLDLCDRVEKVAPDFDDSGIDENLDQWFWEVV